ncbi:MAG: hypothetical protein DRP88_00455 [Candidatus Neomarinimicrobiota bacterium]|nr:MAG: hypothetical protein DRP88_00455 [Candidatus Neomarinimicrobiota bacterium]
MDFLINSRGYFMGKYDILVAKIWIVFLFYKVTYVLLIMMPDFDGWKEIFTTRQCLLIPMS